MALPAALVQRFPRLSAEAVDRCNGDYGLVLSSFKQLERALRSELGATGRCMPEVFRSVQAQLPQVVLSHLRYLNYERNQLAHDASRHLLSDIGLYISRYNEAMEAIEAAAALAGASTAVRVGAFNPFQHAPRLGMAAAAFGGRAAPAAATFGAHAAPAAAAFGGHAAPAVPSWEQDSEEEEERQLQAALEASLREYQQMLERQQQRSVPEKPLGESSKAAGALGDTAHTLAAGLEAAGDQAEAWLEHSPQQQQRQQQEQQPRSPEQLQVPEDPVGPAGGGSPGREEEDEAEEQRQLAAALEVSVREQHLSASQLEALERQQVEEALQASLQHAAQPLLPSALEVRLERGGHANGAENAIIDPTYSQPEDGEVVLLSPSPLRQHSQQLQQAAKRQRLGVPG